MAIEVRVSYKLLQLGYHEGEEDDGKGDPTFTPGHNAVVKLADGHVIIDILLCNVNEITGRRQNLSGML